MRVMGWLLAVLPSTNDAYFDQGVFSCVGCSRLKEQGRLSPIFD